MYTLSCLCQRCSTEKSSLVPVRKLPPDIFFFLSPSLLFLRRNVEKRRSPAGLKDQFFPPVTSSFFSDCSSLISEAFWKLDVQPARRTIFIILSLLSFSSIMHSKHRATTVFRQKKTLEALFCRISRPRGCHYSRCLFPYTFPLQRGYTKLRYGFPKNKQARSR